MARRLAPRALHPEKPFLSSWFGYSIHFRSLSRSSVKDLRYSSNPRDVNLGFVPKLKQIKNDINARGQGGCMIPIGISAEATAVLVIECEVLHRARAISGIS